MAVYSNGIETKKRLISVTYGQMLLKDASQVRAREIAQESGCSPAAIYRHFNSLEHLIAVSSIRILDEYTAEYGALIDRSLDPVERYLEGWRMFDCYAFQRPDIFHRLFWGPGNASFEAAIEEYYGLFPYQGSERNPVLFFSLFFNGDIVNRDYVAMGGVIDEGLIDQDDATYLSKMNSMMLRGMLEDCMVADADGREAARRECDALVEEGLRRSMERCRLRKGR